MRIAHFLARCGLASRRKAEEFVSAGRVTLNGAVVRDLGRQVDPEADSVEVDGRPYSLKSGHLTLAMNKPAGVVVTRTDPEGRPTVYDILPVEFAARANELVYVGRLDAGTTGLLLLTTDGEMANRLMHPRHHVRKTYVATVDRLLDSEALGRMRGGMKLDDFETQPAEVYRRGGTTDRPRYEVIIAEGKKRQVRLMFQAAGARVLELERTQLGGLRLLDLRLEPGQFVVLTPEELELLEREDETPG